MENKVYICTKMQTGFQRYKDIWWKYDGDRDIWILSDNYLFHIAHVCYYNGAMLITDCMDRFNKFLNEGA